jgi:K+-sensing histidine kinase KdpD
MASSMGRRDRRRAVVSISSGLALPLVVAAGLVPLRQHVADAALSLVLAAVVVAVAAFGDRRGGLVASVSSGLWFDFFLTRSYERFSIASAGDVETTVALLVVGVGVTEIAVLSRRYYSVASAEGDYLALLRDLSDLVATGVSPDAAVALASDDLSGLLSLRQCRFERSTPSRLRPRLRRNGEVEVGEIRFDVANDGLPEGEIELVAQSHGREYGVFVMEAGDRRSVSIEQRVVALAIADQVGAALAAASQAA